MRIDNGYRQVLDRRTSTIFPNRKYRPQTLGGAGLLLKILIGLNREMLPQVCQPVMADGTNCSHPSNLGRYIETFSCSGGVDRDALRDMRLSFPSSHASFSAYTMVFAAVRFPRALLVQQIDILFTRFICRSI